ncbi:MAG: METTL5 family protein [Candidatus Bathyarchaeales archaeon]
MQKRLIRKLDLELALSQVKPHPSPKPGLEQYTIPVDVAAIMLHIAAYTYNDIIGKTVLDLGCGTGRLALGAVFLGAKKVVGVDVDKNAVKTALETSRRMELKKKVQWVVADIDAIIGNFDTILQNPPFGVQRRGADRKFIKKALETGRVIYSLHKSPNTKKDLIKKLKAKGTNVMQTQPSPFLKWFIEKHGGRIKSVYSMVMAIPYMFPFHRRKKHEFVVDLYIIEKMKAYGD